MYLGTKHMVTGVRPSFVSGGVIFFSYRLKDIVQYVSLFTLGTAVRCCWAFLGMYAAIPI